VRIVGPNFIVRLRVQDDMVVEAARPISYMRGWKLERVRALCRRWDWKIELSDASWRSRLGRERHNHLALRRDANRACAAMDKASI